MYRKTCKTGLVWLGGNGARGSKGTKRGYFVLVHVAKRPAPPHHREAPASEPEPEPAPAPGPGPGPAISRSRGREGGKGVGNPHSAYPPPQLGLRRSATEGGGSPLFDGFNAAAETAGSFAVALDDEDGYCCDEVVDDDTDNDSVVCTSSIGDRAGGQGGGGGGAGPRRITSALRNSFESLQGATASPDGTEGTDAFASGGSRGGASSAVEGERSRSSFRHQQQRRPAGSRNRGMSTTDAAVLDTHLSAVGNDINRVSGRSGSGNGSSGGAGRARAWTGDEDLFMKKGGGGGGGGVGGVAGGADTFGNNGVYRSSPRFGRSGERSKTGLQRISALWNTEKDGPLSQIPVPFDRVGRSWSRTFNVDAAKTGGPLETSGATLGVSVSALAGQFHRTRVVTLYPRLIVRNFLGFPLEVSEGLRLRTFFAAPAAAVVWRYLSGGRFVGGGGKPLKSTTKTKRCRVHMLPLSHNLWYRKLMSKSITANPPPPHGLVCCWHSYHSLYNR